MAGSGSPVDPGPPATSNAIVTVPLARGRMIRARVRRACRPGIGAVHLERQLGRHRRTRSPPQPSRADDMGGTNP